jgi:hypothetical protein
MAAPTASAAVALASTTKAALASTTKAALAKATLIGAALGWFGVLMGMNALEPVFDEREERELRRFRNLVLTVITVGCAALGLTASSAMTLLVVLQTLYLVLIYLYAVRLPRILERRMEYERSVDPEMAKKNRRQWMWATIGRAAVAALSGVMIMVMIQKL